MVELIRTDLSVQRERAVLVKVSTRALDHLIGDPLGELASLAAAAGAIVVDGMTQRVKKINTRTYLGSGKAVELAERVKANDANLVIFDNDLSPAQIRELERCVGCKVLDRSELILDIFAARARTHEARLQVELAQLEYTAPRLRGMWTHLERIAGAAGGSGAGVIGGIGTRGPGEKQIEIDRRIVRDRISALRRELAVIDGRKVRTIRSRENCFTASLVGYTNSGKSTLLNALTGAEQYVADKLFATLDTKTVRWEVDDSLTVLLSDTVGFVRDLPHRLVASFRATLEEAVHADLLLHVVDASNREAPLQVESVNAVLAELGCADVSTLIVLNKIDAVTDEANIPVLQSRLRDALLISAKTGEGLEALRAAVRGQATVTAVTTTLKVPSAEGRLLAEIEREATVLERRYANEHVELDVRMDRGRFGRLMGQHGCIEDVGRSAAAGKAQ